MGIGHFTSPETNERNDYTMKIPLGTMFKPEFIKVTLTGHVMTIKAKLYQPTTDEVSEDCQKFVKKFTIPSSLDITKAKSKLTPQGFLEVKIPCPFEAMPPGSDHNHNLLRLREEDRNREDGIEIQIVREENL